MIRRRLLTGTFSNLAAKVTAVATWFLMTPFLLSQLGAGGYALWVLLASIASYGFLLELGIGGAVVKYVSEHVARGERESARAVIASARWLFGALAVAALGVSVLVAPLLPPLLGVTPAERPEVAWLTTMMGLNVALTIAMTPPFAVLRGLQRYDLFNGAHIVITLCEAAAVVAALLAGGGLVGMVGALIPTNILAWVLASWLVHRTAPDLTVRWRGGTRGAVGRIASFSGSLFAIDFAGRLQTRTDEFVIALFGPLSAVTPYALARKLGELSEMLVVQCVNVAMPLASELHAGGDRRKLQTLYIAASRIAIGIAMPVVIVLVVLGGEILTLWVGESYAVHAPLVAALAVAYLFRSVQCPAIEILLGMARHHVIAVTSLASGATNIALSMLLLPRFGLLGVALGTLIPNAVALLFVVVPFANRTVGISRRTAAREIWLPAFLPAVAASAAVVVLRSQMDAAPMVIVAAGATVTALVYAAGYLWMPATALERRLVGDAAIAALHYARPSGSSIAAAVPAGWRPSSDFSTTVKLALRNVYAACLNALPDSWFLPIRARYVGARDGSLRKRALGVLLRCLRYKNPDRRLASFPLVDEPAIRLANVNSIVVRHLYWFGLGGWEGTEIRAWQYFCSRATRVLEIGANVGFYTVCGAQAAPGASYTAVEPHPRTAETLRRNLELNGLSGVDVIEAAVVGHKTSNRMTLVVPAADQDETPPGSFLEKGGEVAMAGRASFDVPVVDIHALLAGVDLLKLDVEGYEYEILHPVREFLVRERPTLFVEVLPAARKLQQLIAELVQSGAYRIYVSGGTTVELDRDAVCSNTWQSTHRTRDVFLLRADCELPAAAFIPTIGAAGPAAAIAPPELVASR